jgi:eukaryotic-like serine/threonine-protein kinase
VSSDGLRGAAKWAVSSTGGQEPRWRGDGQELFYVAGSAVMSVDVTAPGETFASSPPRRLFEVQLPELRRNRLVVTRDGQRFLVNTTVGQLVERIDVLVGWASAAR